MNMLEIEEIVQNQSEQQIKMDPEIQKMQNMTEKEALKYLGLERTPVYGDLDQILSKKNSWARMIVNYLMENYPELMPLMVCNGKLEILLDQRIAQATEQYDTMQKNLQEKMKVQTMSFPERVLAEQRIREQIMEVISKEILYKPLII
ncbi:MAG: TnpV protein [Roseburia faecis]